jgi:predicted ribosome quality control (RQC) complex YloA/Tae2 family protein
MSLSWHDLEAIANEARPTLEGANLQKLQWTEFTGLLLFFKSSQKKTCFHICLARSQTGAYLTDFPPAKSSSEPPFLINAKQALKGKRLKYVQLDPNDRILNLIFGNAVLCCELHPSKPNLYLLSEDNAVLHRWQNYGIARGQHFTPAVEKMHGQGKLKFVSTKNASESAAKHFEKIYKNKNAQKIRKNLAKQVKQLGNKLAKLENDFESTNKSNHYLNCGNLIKNNLFQLDTKKIYTDCIAIPGVDQKILLEKSQTPADAMNFFYGRYKKLQRKKEQLKNRVATVRQELTSAQEALQHAEECSDDQLLTENSESNTQNLKHAPTKNESSKNISGVIQKESPDGFKLLIGKHAEGNEKILKLAKGNDYWLHARGYSGSHCVVKRQGKKEIPESTVLWAATQAARHSKAKNQTSVEVDVAERSDVKKLRGSKPGLVKVMRSRVVNVKL